MAIPENTIRPWQARYAALQRERRMETAGIYLSLFVIIAGSSALYFWIASFKWIPAWAITFIAPTIILLSVIILVVLLVASKGYLSRFSSDRVIRVGIHNFGRVTADFLQEKNCWDSIEQVGDEFICCRSGNIFCTRWTSDLRSYATTLDIEWNKSDRQWDTNMSEVAKQLIARIESVYSLGTDKKSEGA